MSQKSPSSKFKSIVIVGFVFILGFFSYPFLKTAVFAQEGPIAVFFQALEIVREQHVEKKTDLQQLMYGAIKGMLAALNDPYTRFLEPKSYTDMQERMDGKFYGVGIQIGMKNNQVTVINPILGTPAFRAGVQPMDVIKTVDGKSLENLSLEEVVSYIRGPKGTKVVLGIQRKKDKKEKILPLSMVRDEIKIQSVTKTQMVDPAAGIGYVQLATFESKKATEELAEAISQLEKQSMQALILDLRNNGGGLLQNAIEIASIFVQEGTVVSTVDRNGSAEVFEVLGLPKKRFYKKHLVILINGASASASEIVAGAVADHGRGKLIGTHTFGKASVQVVRQLSDGSAILVTIAKYLTPKGTDINKHGIKPDMEVRIPTATIEEAINNPNYVYQEKKDLQLQAAIKYLKNLLKAK